MHRAEFAGEGGLRSDPAVAPGLQGRNLRLGRLAARHPGLGQQRQAILVADLAGYLPVAKAGGEARAGQVDILEVLEGVGSREEGDGVDVEQQARRALVVAQAVGTHLGVGGELVTRTDAPLAAVAGVFSLGTGNGRTKIRERRQVALHEADVLAARADHVGVGEVLARRRQFVRMVLELVVAEQGPVVDREASGSLQLGEEDFLDLGAGDVALGGIDRALHPRNTGDEQALAPSHHLVAETQVEEPAIADGGAAIHIGIEQAGAGAYTILGLGGELVMSAEFVDGIR
ncbi:hypothetical protein D3C75_595570 [compost metagenome]